MGNKFECGRGFSFNFRNPKCKLNTLTKFNSEFSPQKVTVSPKRKGKLVFQPPFFRGENVQLQVPGNSAIVTFLGW